MKCESSSYKHIGICGLKARFFIVDIDCASDRNSILYGNYSGFWVCDECISSFIEKNEDNPHYIIIKELTK